VFPVLVVPNGRLWKTEYDTAGNRTRDPERVDRCSYFVNLTYSVDFTISHLEFLTLDGLLAFVDGLSAANFPWDHVRTRASLFPAFPPDSGLHCVLQRGLQRGLRIVVFSRAGRGFSIPSWSPESECLLSAAREPQQVS
jgi:hypothetical protein